MTVIDIHTHSLSEDWLRRLRKYGAPEIELKPLPDGREVLVERGAQSFLPCPEMLDYDLRIKDMDAAGIDISVVSLTSPSVYWGGAEVSAETARSINDSMAAAQTAYPDRIRWFATLPWQYPDLAVEELERAAGAGAVGVMVLANIHGTRLVDPSLAQIWRAIDRRALPVLVHPTTPPGVQEMDLGRLLASVGFTFDTSLAIGRMVLEGFLDTYPNLTLIASHGGGNLPYLASRMDLFFEQRMPAAERKISEPPSAHLGRIYYDSIVYQPTCLKLCVEMGGPAHVLFGTDYPHPADIPILMELADALPADQSRAIKGGNARRLFGL